MANRFLWILVIVAFFQTSVEAQPHDGRISSQKIVIEHTEKNYKVSAEYPEFYRSSDKTREIKLLNDAVKAYVERLFSTNGGKLTEAGGGVEEEALSEDGLNSVDITCEVVRSDTKFVSIKFERYFYRENDVHGITDIFGFNYAVQQQKIIKLEDLFDPGVDYVKQICDYCDVDLIRQLRGFWNRGDMTEKSLNQFTFSHKKLNMLFSAYQVASYAAGTPEVSMSFSKLSGIKGDVSRKH